MCISYILLTKAVLSNFFSQKKKEKEKKILCNLAIKHTLWETNYPTNFLFSHKFSSSPFVIFPIITTHKRKSMETIFMPRATLNNGEEIVNLYKK